MRERRSRFTFFAVFFTFFIDTLSWSVVFPIFAPYFLNPQNPILPTDLSAGARTTVLGLFLMAFSLGQFLGAPLMGEYADRHGRKKALTWGVLFTLAGLLLSAWSMQVYSLLWLFVGRLLTGLFASTTSVCFSCISDLSQDEKEKVRNFGYLAMTAGISFVFGAFVGGKLSDETINPSFSPNVPLWLASGLTFVNFLFLLFGFRETARINPSVHFHLFQAFGHIKMALKMEKIKKVYLIYFLFLFAWTILLQFIPVLTVERFLFTNSNLGDLALFMGICWAIGSGYLNKWLSHFFDAPRILEGCLVGFTIFCCLIIVPKHIYGVIGILGFCVILGAIGWPICTSLLSNLAPQGMQGKVLGISQSIQSLAMTVAPVIAGLAFHVSLGLPFLIAGGACLIASLIYYFTLKDR